jgi:probable HAF family extracellular repeat protein
MPGLFGAGSSPPVEVLIAFAQIRRHRVKKISVDHEIKKTTTSEVGMKNTITIIGLAVLAALSSQPLFSQALSSQAKATVPTYSVTDLGLGGRVAGISNAGLVTAADAAGDAVLYWTDGSNQIRDLALDPRLPAACGFTAPYTPLEVWSGGISDNGMVVVTAVPYFDGYAFEPHCVAVYNPSANKGGGAWTYKQTLDPKGDATGVNNSGQVIGELDDNLVGFGPACDFINGGDFISAGGINDSGQIPGIGDRSQNFQLCTNGIWQVLIPNFPGEATAINDKSQIVGYEFVEPDGAGGYGAVHAFLYSAGKITDLGALPGSTYSSSSANSINKFAQIVGVSYTATSYTSFLYQNGVMYDLAALISPTDPHKGLIQFEGDAYINDNGVIVSSGISGGFSHLYVLTPIKTK